ncbi:Rv2175c family DNA-binding protein [Citricoccus nitrophenolicus]|uniref:Rv2175c family DNA-binding protein n=1 Tax=Citricoccus nitrophenolicus TaxID=863575 RepID=UPI0031ED9AA9
MNTAARNHDAPQEPALETLVGDWEYFPDLAEKWDIPVTRVHNMVGEGRLLAAKVGERQARAVPTLFLTESGPLESLKGTLSVLQDAGFTDEQAIRWLFTEDETLPGRPVDVLREGRKTEIRRRAQALAW